MIKNRDIAWSALGNQGSQILAFAISTVLARGLSAADFGLYALVQVVVIFGAIFSEGGVRVSVVQLKQGDKLGDQHLLAYAIAVGVGAGIVVSVFAPSLGGFFHEPKVVSALWVLSLSFIPSAVSGVYFGILQREGRFRELGAVGLGATFGAGMIAIGSAFFGAGYWSLVLQGLARPIIAAAAGYYFAAPRLRPEWRLSDCLATLRLTSDLVMFELINFAHRNLDRVLIGRSLGSATLGHYTRGYTLLLTFNQAVSGTLAPVFHSACARSKNVKADIANLYGTELSRSLWIGAPFMGACAALAPDVIRIVWGPRWEESVSIFKWLALAGIHQTAFGYFGAVFSVTANTRRLLICSIITSTLFLGTIVVSLDFGIEVVARNYMFASWLVFIGVTWYVWSGLLKAPFIELFRRCLPPVMAGFMIYGVLPYLVNLLIADDTGRLSDSLLRVVAAGALLSPVYWLGRGYIIPKTRESNR